MPAIENRNWQQVQNRQIDAEQNRKHDKVTESALRLLCGHHRDTNRPSDVRRNGLRQHRIQRKDR